MNGRCVANVRYLRSNDDADQKEWMNGWLAKRFFCSVKAEQEAGLALL
jgi:hypothetical protein